jgi:hypothetical protein
MLSLNTIQQWMFFAAGGGNTLPPDRGKILPPVTGGGGRYPGSQNTCRSLRSYPVPLHPTVPFTATARKARSLPYSRNSRSRPPSGSRKHSRRHCGRMGQPEQHRRAELQNRAAAGRPPGSRSTSGSIGLVTNTRLPSFSRSGTASCAAGRIRGTLGLPLCGHCFKMRSRRPGRVFSTSLREKKGPVT